MNYEVRRVSVWSVAKISFVLGGVFGFLIGLLLWMASTALMSLPFEELGGSMDDMGALGAAGAMFPFLLAVFYAVASMIGNAILAGVYNLLAAMVGGLELTLIPRTPPAYAPAPPSAYPPPTYAPPAAPPLAPGSMPAPQAPPDAGPQTPPPSTGGRSQ